MISILVHHARKWSTTAPSKYHPSDQVCVDESMARWYGMGGYWINMGLPQYVAIDRKPENGCEIQNSADGRCGVMMQLKLVETAESELLHAQANEEGLLHGIVILKRLVEPWAHKGDRVVCADSYFASVGAAEEMARLGLGFIGVVKTATRRFPQSYLSQLEMEARGEVRGVICKGDDDRPLMMAFVWMDRDRRYFISNRSSLEPGEPYVRNRWRQVDTTPNAEPERVQLEIAQPKAAEVYYETCAMIDRHNRVRQDDLMLERKLGTMSWWIRVGLSIFGMCVVDGYYVAKGCNIFRETPNQFFEGLAEELIDNEYDGRSIRRRSPPQSDESRRRTLDPTSHLSPSKRKRKLKDGTVTRNTMQGRCGICDRKTSYVCNTCAAMYPDKEAWCCHTKCGRECFNEHCAQTHNTVSLALL